MNHLSWWQRYFSESDRWSVINRQYFRRLKIHDFLPSSVSLRINPCCMTVIEVKNIHWKKDTQDQAAVIFIVHYLYCLMLQIITDNIFIAREGCRPWCCFLSCSPSSNFLAHLLPYCNHTFSTTCHTQPPDPVWRTILLFILSA